MNGVCAAGAPVNCNDGVACTADALRRGDRRLRPRAEQRRLRRRSGLQRRRDLHGDGVPGGDAAELQRQRRLHDGSSNQATGCQHVPLSCGDSNECTTDSCNPATGCQNTPVANGTTCGDDASRDVSHGGACAHPANTNPCGDDGNVCTNDVCAAGACTHPNNTGACADDGSSCTNDVCSGGRVRTRATAPAARARSSRAAARSSIEAEHFLTNTGRASHTWDVTSNGSASGGQTMVAEPEQRRQRQHRLHHRQPAARLPRELPDHGHVPGLGAGSGRGHGRPDVHAGIDGTGPASAER